MHVLSVKKDARVVSIHCVSPFSVYARGVNHQADTKSFRRPARCIGLRRGIMMRRGHRANFSVWQYSSSSNKLGIYCFFLTVQVWTFLPFRWEHFMLLPAKLITMTSSPFEQFYPNILKIRRAIRLSHASLWIKASWMPKNLFFESLCYSEVFLLFSYFFCPFPGNSVCLSLQGIYVDEQK